MKKLLEIILFTVALYQATGQTGFSPEDFYHYTDQEWKELVLNNKVTEQPDWVNIYLADSLGNIREKGIELPNIAYYVKKYEYT